MTHAFDVVVAGIWQTLAITVGSLAIGLVVALPIALMRRSTRVAIRFPAALFVELVRAIPPIVWLFVIFYGLGDEGLRTSTLQAAVAGLGLIAAAYIAEIYRAGIGAVRAGQWEAAYALGLGQTALYRRVIAPQALVIVVPPVATYAIGLLKDSAIASVIGAQDITFRAFQETQATLKGLEVFGTTALLYLALSLPVAFIARYTGHLLARRYTT